MTRAATWAGWRSFALLVASLLLLAALTPRGGAASPTPAETPAGAPSPISLSGHWAVAGTSGFDIRQTGTRFQGSSIAGIRFAGSLAGLDATFTFWEGPSFAKADPDTGRKMAAA